MCLCSQWRWIQYCIINETGSGETTDTVAKSKENNSQNIIIQFRVLNTRQAIKNLLPNAVISHTIYINNKIDNFDRIWAVRCSSGPRNGVQDHARYLNF